MRKSNRKCPFRLVMCPGMDDVRCSLAVYFVEQCVAFAGQINQDMC